MSRLWWLFLILGLVPIVVGFLALSATFVATMASVLVFGVLLLIAGGAEIVHAPMVRKFGGFAIHLLSAATVRTLTTPFPQAG